MQTTDEDVVKLARRLNSYYQNSHSLMKSLGHAGRDSELLKCEISHLRCTGALPEHVFFENKRMGEFVKIVAFGIENGANVERTLLMFAVRLELEIKRKNRIREKTGGLQALTLIGMSVFFPLFSGISTIIISSSLGLFDKGADVIGRNFLSVAIAYVFIILYLSSAFAHSERSPLKNVSSLAPYLALAVAIILISQNYLSAVL